MKQKTSGVNPKLIKKYEFEDHQWGMNKNVPSNIDFLTLAENCVKIDGNYYMRKKGTLQWVKFKSDSDAKKEALNTWLYATLPSGNMITEEMIDEFFTGIRLIKQEIGDRTFTIKQPVGSCPNIYSSLVCPMGPNYVTYNNQHYLNTWYDAMITPDERDLPIGKLVLLMIYGSLCNGRVDKERIDQEAERIYEMVINDNYDLPEFRFLMYWLAATWQQPGINLLTNIWLLGQLEGIGKGTLIGIMSYVLGKSFVGPLNQSEIEAGWNDHLKGLQIVEVNEFDTDGKMKPKQWNSWIKAHTIEPHLKIRERNTTSYSVPNVGNYIFTTNRINQQITDKNDRRNQFIQTSQDPFWVAWSQHIQGKYFIPQPEKVASGFACILDQVRVDLKFISRSFTNEIREHIVSINQTIIEEWFDNDPDISKDSWIAASVLYEDFKDWYRSANPSGLIPSLTAWGRAMRNDSLVEYKRANTGVRYLVKNEIRAQVQIPKVEEISLEANKITGDTEILQIEDCDMEPAPPINFAELSKLERVRLALARMDAEDR